MVEKGGGMGFNARRMVAIAHAPVPDAIAMIMALAGSRVEPRVGSGPVTD